MSLWWNSSAYNHGFLIAPISAWLVWLKRRELAAVTPTGSLLGAAVTAGFAVLWLTADAADVDEGRHIAFVGIVQGILLACLGWRVCVVLAFPILYLWLMVPAGSPLLPLLQDIATRISSGIIGWSGIPIWVEGAYIEVPTGAYHVALECAGLNFILATLAISPLYAYLFYRSMWKRVLAVVAALVLAVVMNGVRIAGIIMLAHWSGHRINIVDDHLLYGWGFFALVLLGVGFVGLYFADADDNEPATETAPAPSRHGGRPGRGRTVVAAALSVLAIVAVFLHSERVKAEAETRYSVSLEPPSQVGDWRSVDWSADWSPVFPGADLEVRQSYARNGDVIDLYIAYYAQQAPGKEMVARGNQVVDTADWSVVRSSRETVGVSDGVLPMMHTLAASPSGRRNVLWTYWVDDALTVDPLMAKALQSKSKLLFGDQRAAVIAVSSAERAGPAAAESLLTSFLEALPPIADLLRGATLAPSAPSAPADPD